ncbi:redoxin domain-containing protein [candidate division KSB1 bacterium]|nr:redoxin domain-containing protein [candidate division KSB1 bacterium]
MKQGIAVFVVAFLLTAFALASADEQLVTIKPDKPTVGTEITIRYNPLVKGAMLFGAQAMDVQVLMLWDKDRPLLLEAPMKMQGKIWEAKLKLQGSNQVFALVRFVAGEIIDTNQDKYWDFLVHDQSGKPVEGAHFARSQSYQFPFFEFRREKDLMRAREEAMAEESLYPKQPRTKFWLWDIELAEKKGDTTLTRTIINELEAMTKESASDDKVLSMISNWYGRVGQAEKAKTLQDQLIAKNPKGDLAKQIKLEKVYQTRDKEERTQLALAYLEEFSALEARQKSSLVNLLIDAQKFDKAEALIPTIQPPDGNLLNTLAWAYIEKDVKVERGVDLAKQGVEALRTTDQSAKPPHLSKKQWEQSQRTSLGYVLDTYAFGLFKLGQYQEAQQAYREAYDLTEGSNADINERLVQCYLKNGDYVSAIEVTKACIEKSKYNDKLLEYGKEAFVKKEGNAEGFDKLAAAAKERGAAKAKEKLLAERVNKPAPDFSARNLAGESVQLAQLKGKVVVLDFWATWCGPCKAAFPYVQKVYEKYKNDPDVVILAVNTWERESGAEKEKLVKKFLEDNKYTFPVVYDEASVVEKYKVEGIPTQFFIDRKGVIQFKAVGFEGPEMEQGMAMKIDMLLSSEQLSAK